MEDEAAFREAYERNEQQGTPVFNGSKWVKSFGDMEDRGSLLEIWWVVVAWVPLAALFSWGVSWLGLPPGTDWRFVAILVASFPAAFLANRVFKEGSYYRSRRRWRRSRSRETDVSQQAPRLAGAPPRLTAKAPQARCVYCRGDFAAGCERVACSSCEAQTHADCWAEAGDRCPTCRREERPRQVKS